MAGSLLIPAQRRRAQNRASQRAFRERKERHVKNLEQQLEDLHGRYEELLRSYDQQKDEVLSLKVELKELHSKTESLQQCETSTLEIASKRRAPSFQSENDALRYQEDDDLIMQQSQALTPTSNLENQTSTSRGSNAEEQTPFGSLLPLTPVEKPGNLATFCPSGQFFAAGDISRCYNVDSYLEVQQHQQQDGFGSPGFNKEFAIDPSMGVFGGWR